MDISTFLVLTLVVSVATFGAYTVGKAKGQKSQPAPEDPEPKIFGLREFEKFVGANS